MIDANKVVDILKRVNEQEFYSLDIKMMNLLSVMVATYAWRKGEIPGEMPEDAEKVIALMYEEGLLVHENGLSYLENGLREKLLGILMKEAYFVNMFNKRMIAVAQFFQNGGGSPFENLLMGERLYGGYGYVPAARTALRLQAAWSMSSNQAVLLDAQCAHLLGSRRQMPDGDWLFLLALYLDMHTESDATHVRCCPIAMEILGRNERDFVRRETISPSIYLRLAHYQYLPQVNKRSAAWRMLLRGLREYRALFGSRSIQMALCYYEVARILSKAGAPYLVVMHYADKAMNLERALHGNEKSYAVNLLRVAKLCYEYGRNESARRHIKKSLRVASNDLVQDETILRLGCDTAIKGNDVAFASTYFKSFLKPACDNRQDALLRLSMATCMMRTGDDVGCCEQLDILLGMQGDLYDDIVRSAQRMKDELKNRRT